MGEVTLHHLRKTAARDTDEYVFSQLIPYIGNKRKLLDLIHQAIKLTNIENGTFVDLFSGSTVVSRFAKKLGFRVLSNDWEPYSEQIAMGTVVLNEIPKFENLGGVDNEIKALEFLNLAMFNYEIYTVNRERMKINVTDNEFERKRELKDSILNKSRIRELSALKK